MSYAGWKRKKIGELFDVQLGKMLNEKAKQGEQYPYLANFNVRWGSFDLSKLNKMYFSEKEKEKFSLKSGDLLMCEGGEIGRCAVWNKTHQSIYYQKALHRLRPLNHDIKSLFVYYFMEHIASKGELSKIVGESSIAHLTREKLLHLIVPTPPRNEQEMIVHNLSTWDKAIEKVERLITVKEIQFSWLLNKLISEGNWSGKWKKVKLGELGEISSAGVDKKSKHGEVSVRLINYLDVYRRDLIYSNELFHSVTAQPAQAGRCSVRKGDIFFTPSSEVPYDIGHSAVAMEDIPDAVYSYHVVRLRLKENVDLLYRAYAFKSQEFYRQAERLCDGSGQRYVISQSNFRRMEVSIPPLSQQKIIAKILNTAQKEIDLLKKQLEAYRKQKRGLMQKLLTGQWWIKKYY
jgi:type I restriction enzyme, S subunit